MPYHDLELLAVAGSEVSVRCSDKLAIIMEKLADPRADTQEYLEKHMINELLEVWQLQQIPGYHRQPLLLLRPKRTGQLASPFQGHKYQKSWKALATSCLMIPYMPIDTPVAYAVSQP